MVHKSGVAGRPNNIYVLDSSNIQHLDRPEEDIDAISLESRCWKKIRIGLKPTIKFMCEMSIQSLFDQRNFYLKLNQIFNSNESPDNRLTIPRLHFSC